MSYTVKGKQYADYFPHYFAENHKKGTGPIECADCSYYGRVHGIFMGYCESCATVYKGYRGPGMTDIFSHPIEQQINDNRLFFIKKVKLTPSEREWSDCRQKFWVISLFILICIVLMTI